MFLEIGDLWTCCISLSNHVFGFMLNKPFLLIICSVNSNDTLISFVFSEIPSENDNKIVFVIFLNIRKKICIVVLTFQMNVVDQTKILQRILEAVVFLNRDWCSLSEEVFLTSTSYLKIQYIQLLKN